MLPVRISRSIQPAQPTENRTPSLGLVYQERWYRRTSQIPGRRSELVVEIQPRTVALRGGGSISKLGQVGSTWAASPTRFMDATNWHQMNCVYRSRPVGKLGPGRGE